MSSKTYELTKRAIDIVLALFLMGLFFPVWIIVPFLIRMDSSGPIIFPHRRVGRYGKEFTMYKFRSMVEGAEEYMYRKDPKLLKKFKEGDWKLENDPRITRLGRVLRSITIDEFPQLYNVLKGEMSIVGPRAYVPSELAEQPERYPKTKPLVREILTMKPGITGPWQTSGRNEIPFDKRAVLDAEYAREKSILNDLLIIVKTPMAMLSKW
jgi:lipopolysaccharide/colanic/teichoic acid biosynthesis glycosyltransferase